MANRRSNSDTFPDKTINLSIGQIISSVLFIIGCIWGLAGTYNSFQNVKEKLKELSDKIDKVNEKQDKVNDKIEQFSMQIGELKGKDGISNYKPRK